MTGAKGHWFPSYHSKEHKKTQGLPKSHLLAETVDSLGQQITHLKSTQGKGAIDRCSQFRKERPPWAVQSLRAS
jgi:hypothetical protein